MPLDTLDSLVGKVQARLGPLPDYYLIVDWIVAAARELFRERDWTFRRRQASFLFHAAYSTGTATATRGSNLVDFAGGAAITDAHVGRQLRLGDDMPIVTIRRRVSATRVEIDQPWAEDDQTAVTFEIYSAYVTVPSDFDSFISVVDLRRSFQLNWWQYTADNLDHADPKRTRRGDTAYAIVLRDFASSSVGQVGALIQVRGSGNKPTSGGSYSGASDAVFTIEMTAADVFKWKKGSGSYITGVSIDADGIPQDLSDGVQIAFPNDVAYTNGDVFVIPVTAVNATGDPRYEPWPHIVADEARPYLYLCRPPDLTDAGATLPRFIPGDVIVELALMKAAMWKHPDNKYFDLRLASMHRENVYGGPGRIGLIADVIREDEARESTMLTYDSWTNLPTYDSEVLAGSDFGYEFDVLD